MVWYSHLFQNFPQFIVIHTIKGFGIVNKAEIDVSLELFFFSSVQSLSSVRLFVTLWAVACKAPLTMEFSNKNTGVGCHVLLQGTFPTLEFNLHFLVSCIGSWVLYH